MIFIQNFSYYIFIEFSAKGISKENILSDFWIFKYRIETVTARLNIAEQANVAHLKTWMVRCKAEIFDR